MTYAFSFDASACSGCKACQAACKDKNNLPPGVLWRRVIEVSGGEWIQDQTAWTNTVFAYNFSLACNHCVHPKCAGVCPTNAYQVRDDGIVLLDSSRCIGCGYCNWACPYAVPQYNQLAGVMSKCNFCYDAIDAGEPPACVAACPLRVLDFVEIDTQDLEKPGISLWELPGSEHPFPLPVFSRTQPHIRLKQHPAMLNKLEKVVANREEIKPQKPKSELPLVVFTLLAQMAVGAFWTCQWLFKPLWSLVQSETLFLRLLPVSLVGLCLALSMLVSFAHLGMKRNVWRVFSNLRKSWLSREILTMGLFGMGCLLFLMIPSMAIGLLISLLGYGLIYSMANVYQLRSMAAWNTRRTLAGFLLSALLLGQFFIIPVFVLEAQFSGINLAAVYPPWINLFSIMLLAAELVLAFSVKTDFRKAVGLRVGVILVIIMGLGGALFWPFSAQLEFYATIFLLLCVEECLGRWLFYSELDRRTL